MSDLIKSMKIWIPLVAFFAVVYTDTYWTWLNVEFFNYGDFFDAMVFPGNYYYSLVVNVIPLSMIASRFVGRTEKNFPVSVVLLALLAAVVASILVVYKLWINYKMPASISSVDLGEFSPLYSFPIISEFSVQLFFILLIPMMLFARSGFIINYVESRAARFALVVSMIYVPIYAFCAGNQVGVQSYISSSLNGENISSLVVTMTKNAPYDRELDGTDYLGKINDFMFFRKNVRVKGDSIFNEGVVYTVNSKYVVMMRHNDMATTTMKMFKLVPLDW